MLGMDFTRIRITRMFCLYIITCKNFALTVWLGESFFTGALQSFRYASLEILVCT